MTKQMEYGLNMTWGLIICQLWEPLQGKNTGWCTAGKETAKTQLNGGELLCILYKGQKIMNIKIQE